MTRRTVGFSVLIFLIVLSFSIATFCFANNVNSGAKFYTEEKNKISENESDFEHPVWPQKSVGLQKEEYEEGSFAFDISEKPVANMIDKLFTVNGIRNIISNELPGVSFLWDWLSLYFSSNWGDELTVDFKTDGIYTYKDRKWTSIYNGGIDPVSIVNFNNKLAVNWGPEYGVFVYNAGNWTRIYYGAEVERMVGFIDRLVIDFGMSYGIFEYNYKTDRWSKIYGKDKTPRDSMISFGDKLIVDFKTDGIYVYDDGVWENIYNGGIDPVKMVVFNGKLAVDFGPDYGIYVFDYYTKIWKKIYRGMAAEMMTGFDKYLAVYLGNAYGLYVYDYDNESWKLIYKGLPIERISGFSNKLAVDFGINYGIYEYTFDTNVWNKIYRAKTSRDNMCASDIFD